MKPIDSRTLLREAKAFSENDLARRTSAKNILTPELISSGRQTPALKKLSTALGGVVRPITTEDLKQFRRAVEAIQQDRRHASGILREEILSQSSKVDVDRSRAEIHHAVPFRFMNGVASFQVSASRKYGDSRHIAQVELTGWQQAVGSPLAPISAAKAAVNQPLRFECDCGRHTFWYRYIATIGGWNHGRAETGFPKLRNSTLSGIACKHVLRVMTELDGAGVRGLMARAIGLERKRLAGKTRKTVLTVEKAHAKKIISGQAAKPRDVERHVQKFKRMLAGKAPLAAQRPLTVEARQRTAASVHRQLVGLGWSKAQAEEVANVIIQGGPAK